MLLPHPLTYPSTGPSYHNDTKFKPLRKDSLPVTLQLPRANFHRDDRREQPDQRRPLQVDSTWYSFDSYELSHRYTVNSSHNLI